MAGNTFGTTFKITTFGESHGAAMGVVIDGCLPGLEVDHALIKQDLARRKPGQNALSSPRNEPEDYEILSGVFEGKTLGTPIAIIIRNKDQQSADYDKLKDVFRPSHADYTYQMKYGFRDHRGGGRQSARETVSRVLAGSFAKMILAKLGVRIQAAVTGVGLSESKLPITDLDFSYAEANLIRCGDPSLAADMINAIEKARDAGDTLGGTIGCVCFGVPVGWGEPVFDKLNADLAKAMLSINAVKAFEMGAGMDSSRRKGSELNDAFENLNGKISTKTNNSGGVQGGISNGESIWFKVGFKAVASIKQEQNTVNLRHQMVSLTIEGRHDPCVVPRAVPIVEAMAALVLVDHYLRQLPNSMQLL